MQNKSKLNTILLVIVIILLAIGIWVILSQKKNVQVENYDFPTSDDITNRTDTSVKTSVPALPVETTIVATNSIQTPAGWKKYTDSQNKFSIEYPKDSDVNSYPTDGGFYNEINLPVFSIRLPEGYQTGTDFSGGFIEISVSPTISKCYYSNYETEDMNLIKSINGINFHYVRPYNDSAMGGLRGTSLLMSTIKNNKCYRITENYSYHDPRGLTEPPYPPHYDEVKVKADLDAIINTLIIN